METTKKIFSINLAAYITAKTKLVPQILPSETPNNYYMIYPECKAVQAAVLEYKTDADVNVNLRDFLNAIKMIRVTMHELAAQVGE